MLDQLEDQIRNMVLDICEVLYRNGIRRVQVGAIMRLIGLDNESAAALDNEFIEVDSTFIELARSYYAPYQFPPTSCTIQ